MAAKSKISREEFLVGKDDKGVFRRNAFWIIEAALELNNPPARDTTLLVDQILHSIFFLGKIHKPPYPPETIVNDEEMFLLLKRYYPRPFKLYSSQLPTRCPLSCVLEMIVHRIGQENENEIIEELQKLILKLKQGKGKDMISFTICVSQRDNNPKSKRYYGVSMSTSGRVPGRIIVAASCLSSWDSSVAGAVMTYYPKGEKKEYFDGTIKLPEEVRCQAFNLSTGDPKPPCASCQKLFGLPTIETKVWAYGNCAEAESLRKLLKNEREVRENTTSQVSTGTGRQRAEQSVREQLMKDLKMEKFKWDNNFYEPQVEMIAGES